jgi:hypothetical protein
MLNQIVNNFFLYKSVLGVASPGLHKMGSQPVYVLITPWHKINVDAVDAHKS